MAKIFSPTFRIDWFVKEAYLVPKILLKYNVLYMICWFNTDLLYLSRKAMLLYNGLKHFSVVAYLSHLLIYRFTFKADCYLNSLIMLL